MKNKQKGSVGVLILVLLAPCLIVLGVYKTLNSPSATKLETTDSSGNTLPSEKKSNESVENKKTEINLLVNENDLSVVIDGKINQTVSLSEDAVLATSIENVKDFRFITDQDVNFDGYNDAAVLTGIGYGGVNYFYDYYVFNPRINKLEKSENLAQIGNPVVDKEKQTITSSFRDGPQWYSEVYKWNGSMFIKSETSR